MIRVQDRNRYLEALERAIIDQDITQFACFVAERVHWSMEHDDEANHGLIVS